MRIDHIQLTIDYSDASSTKVTLICLKHPNVIMATSVYVNLSENNILSEGMSYVKLANGPVVGLSESLEGMLIVSHEQGVLSTVYWDGKKLECMPEGKSELYDPFQVKKMKTVVLGGPVQKVEKKKKRTKMPTEKRLVFQGLGISPNKSLLCIART
jgi:hypothetical protein